MKELNQLYFISVRFTDSSLNCRGRFSMGEILDMLIVYINHPKFLSYSIESL